MLRHLTNTTFIALLLAAFGGCADVLPTEEQTSEATSALTTDQAYFYFTCNATSWSLGDSNRLTALGAGDYSLTYSVSQPWMVSNGDDCVVVRTNELNGWGTEQTYFGAYRDTTPPVDSKLVVPDYARLSGSKHFTVKYPNLGEYKLVLSASRATISIAAAD